MNLAKLITAVEDTTENTFTFNQHVDFITQTEQAIFQAIKFPAITKTQTTNTSTNNSKYLTNTDYLYTKSFVITVSAVNYTLIQKDHSFIEEAYPASTASSDASRPRYYSTLTVDSDGKTEIIFGPAPAGEHATIHTYAAYPDSITKDATAKDDPKTSWLGDNFDNVLLNGALVEAARFMKAEQDIVAMYKEMYITSLKLAQELQSNLNNDSYRPQSAPMAGVQ
jgi:hypothetical protein